MVSYVEKENSGVQLQQEIIDRNEWRKKNNKE